MAKSRISGITVEIGGDVTGLSKALSGVNKEIRDTQSELRDVEKLLKLDPGNVELLGQKMRLLGDEIGSTERKLDALKEAEKQVQQQFERGDISRQQYDALQREIIETESKLTQLRQKANQTANDLDGLGSDARTGANRLDDMGNAADDLERDLRDVGDEAEKTGSTFRDVFSATALVEGIKGIGSAIGDLSAETQEYRKIMGSLDVSSEKAGYTAEETADGYRQLYGVLGDEQTAATALANLQALGLEQSDLMTLINGAIGAWATYGDSIPIDSLAESVNETIRVGQVTGAFADALNWAGTSEDEFNAKLEAATTEAERARLVLDELASQGLPQLGQEWRTTNDDIVAANEAQAEFTDMAAQMSERLSPVTQSVQDGINKIFQAFLEGTDEVDFEALADEIDGAFEFFINEIAPAIEEFFSFLIENKEAVIGVFTALAGAIAVIKITEFVGNLSEAFTKIHGLTTTLLPQLSTMGSTIGTTLSGAMSTLWTTLSTAGSTILTFITGTVVPGITGALSALFAFIAANPVTLVIAAIIAAVVGLVVLITQYGDEIKAVLEQIDEWLQSVFVQDWTEVFGPVLGEILNGFFQTVENIWNSVKQIFEGIINFIQGVFSGNWEQAWTGIQQIFKGIWDGLVAIAKAPINAIIGLINGLIGAVNSAINGLNSISITVPDWVPMIGGNQFGFNIPNIPTIPYLAKGGVLTQGSAIVGEAGPELLTLSGGNAVVQPLTTNNNTTYGAININLYGNISSVEAAQEYSRIIAKEAAAAMRGRGIVSI